MFKHLSKLAVTAGSVAMLSTGAIASMPKPASADTTSTLLTAAAAIGALVLYNNYQHKRQQANTVVGYTGNGGTVYGDGRIVMPNGQTIYPNSNGQYPTGQYAYYNPNANTGNYQYDPNRTGQYDRTGRHRYHGNAYNHQTNNGNGWNGNGQNNARWHQNGNNPNNGDGDNNGRWNRNGNGNGQQGDHGHKNGNHGNDQHPPDHNNGG